MHSKYIELFKEIANATAISAEQVMDYDKQKDDAKGYEAAETLHKDFIELYDKIRDKNFDGQLAREDFARLLVGTLIVMNQLNDRITALKKAMTGYQTDVMPKLQDIVGLVYSPEINVESRLKEDIDSIARYLSLTPAGEDNIDELVCRKGQKVLKNNL